jgi:MoaA/NifB/PqqE/SkfB family radical SAM enzyme
MVGRQFIEIRRNSMIRKLDRMKRAWRMILEDPNYMYSKIISKIAFLTKGAYGRPTRVIALFTNRCNARCVHCHSWKLESVNNEMSTAQWENTFGELRKWLGPIFISITGGEALLRKDSIQLAEYAAQSGFWVQLLTNGYLMTPEVAGRLVRSGIKRIKISLDGSNPEIHDKIRGRDGFFLRATEGLRSLVAERKRQTGKLQIWGKTSVMSLNMEDLPNIVTLARQLGIDGVEFQALEPIYYSEQLRNLKWYENNPLWITDLQKLSEVIQRLRELKTQRYPIINSIENLNMIENYFYTPEQLAYKVHSHEYSRKNRQCRSWVEGLQIMPHGGMRMCHWMNPFAYSRDGNLKLAWKNRRRCWKEPCGYVSDV